VVEHVDRIQAVLAGQFGGQRLQRVFTPAEQAEGRAARRVRGARGRRRCRSMRR
jgi:hypothetical protein